MLAPVSGRLQPTRRRAPQRLLPERARRRPGRPRAICHGNLLTGRVSPLLLWLRRRKFRNSSIEITEATVTPIPTAVARQRRRGTPQHPPRPHPWGNQYGQQISRWIEVKHQKACAIGPVRAPPAHRERSKYSFIRSVRRLAVLKNWVGQNGLSSPPAIWRPVSGAVPYNPIAGMPPATRRTWTKTASAYSRSRHPAWTPSAINCGGTSASSQTSTAPNSGSSPEAQAAGISSWKRSAAFRARFTNRPLSQDVGMTLNPQRVRGRFARGRAGGRVAGSRGRGR